MEIKDCEFPVGYKFVPTEEELLTHYLMNKALFKPLPAQVIPDIDASIFFQQPPKNLVRYSKGEREWYFFTQLGRGGDEKEMKIQKFEDGIGFWKAIGQEEAIYNADGNIFGFKFHFIYYSGTLQNPKKTHWKLDKFRLPIHQEWILLRLTRGMPMDSIPIF
ncbi:NAC-domain protein 101 [Euphorbia peplus]|nr:NAC-domain protein 101 [Euphorbia peplus]